MHGGQGLCVSGEHERACNTPGMNNELNIDHCNIHGRPRVRVRGILFNLGNR